jgi:hypothetical protein
MGVVVRCRFANRAKKDNSAFRAKGLGLNRCAGSAVEIVSAVPVCDACAEWMVTVESRDAYS